MCEGRKTSVELRLQNGFEMVLLKEYGSRIYDVIVDASVIIMNLRIGALLDPQLLWILHRIALRSEARRPVVL